MDWAGSRRWRLVVGLVCVGGPLPAASAAATLPAGELGCSVGVQPGCLAWAGRYPSPSGSEREGGRAIATTPDGSVVVVASTHRDLAYEAATGRLLWSEPNGAPGVVGGQDVAVSPSGTLAVSVGQAAYPHPERVISGEVVLTARQPRTGRRLWQSRYRDPGGGPYTPRAVVVSDAAVFVAGEGLLPRRVFAAAFDPD